MQTRLQGAASRFHVLPAKVAVAVAVAVTVLQCSLRIQVVCPAVIIRGTTAVRVMVLIIRGPTVQ